MVTHMDKQNMHQYTKVKTFNVVRKRRNGAELAIQKKGGALTHEYPYTNRAY